MTERTHFLIGYGERLASDLAAPLGGAPKKHPYSFAEARNRLAPKVKAVAQQLASLPQEACPEDQTVALVTLHPTYLAKTYYPADLLKTYGLDTVGSRTREVSPEKWTKKKPPASAVTSELYVSGPRRRFQQFAGEIDRLQETSAGADDLIKIEDCCVSIEMTSPCLNRSVTPGPERLSQVNGDDTSNEHEGTCAVGGIWPCQTWRDVCGESGRVAGHQ